MTPRKAIGREKKTLFEMGSRRAQGEAIVMKIGDRKPKAAASARGMYCTEA